MVIAVIFKEFPSKRSNGAHSPSSSSSSFKKYFFFIVYSLLRGRESMGEGQRERETQDLKQAPGSEPSAWSPTQGSNSQTARL